MTSPFSGKAALYPTFWLIVLEFASSSDVIERLSIVACMIAEDRESGVSGRQKESLFIEWPT